MKLEHGDARIQRLMHKLDMLRAQDSPNFVPVTLDGKDGEAPEHDTRRIVFDGGDGPLEISADGQAIRNRSPVFGASHHRYRLNPPADPVELAEAERRIGRPLPDGYRQWLLETGNGGAGPCYGLFPLGQEPFRADEPVINLSADFPFTPDRPCRLPDDPDTGSDERAEAILQGIAILAEEGCGMYNILILRGASAGQVWWMVMDFLITTAPIYNPDTGEPFDFLGWYELWLDRALDPDTEALGSYSEFLREEE